jgi:phosphoribosylformylglycinamidine (FGAM) synthase-like enzyme
MGEKTGAEVNLERVPLKYDGIAPWEIWLSESQERMVLAVPPEKWKNLKNFSDEDVDCSDIGTFTEDGRLLVKHGPQVLVDMAMDVPCTTEFPNGPWNPAGRRRRRFAFPSSDKKKSGLP